MHNLINAKPFLASPFQIVLTDKPIVKFEEPKVHAVLDDMNRLYVGTLTGTYNGDAFQAIACFAPGAWVSIHKIETCLNNN